MAQGITSTLSGNTYTYVVTDQAGNSVTVNAQTPPGGLLNFSSSGSLLIDGQIMLSTLMKMLVTGLRPSVIPNTVASFSN